MTAEDKLKIIDAVADIGAHGADFPCPTASETQLLRSIEFLCMALIKVLEDAA